MTLKILKICQIVKRNHVLHQKYQQPDLQKDLFHLIESQEKFQRFLSTSIGVLNKAPKQKRRDELTYMGVSSHMSFVFWILSLLRTGSNWNKEANRNHIHFFRLQTQLRQFNRRLACLQKIHHETYLFLTKHILLHETQIFIFYIEHKKLNLW